MELPQIFGQILKIVIEAFYQAVVENWIDFYNQAIIPTIGLIVGIITLYYGGTAFVGNYKLNRVNFLYNLTCSHREIWLLIINSEFDPFEKESRDLTLKEERLILFLILNTKTSYEAHKLGVHTLSSEEHNDIIGLYSKHPLIRQVWLRFRDRYEPDFVKFIESAQSQIHPVNKSSFSFMRISIKNPFLIFRIKKVE